MAEKKTTKASSEKAVAYENNPFVIGLNGLNLIYEKARGVAILLIIASIIGAFSGSFSSDNKTNGSQQGAWPDFTTEQWVIFAVVVGVIVLAAVFISSMISGISAYTTARVARGHKPTLSEAFHAVLDRFFSYIWLQIILIVKILLWSLLLIVPGIIMAYRYSLANVAFFDKKLSGNAAINESLRLTKGAWLTTFASQALFNIVTLGVINELVNAGAKTILYRQFTALDDKQKPDAHILSWITLFLPFAIALLLVAFVISIVFISLGLGLLSR